jgi:hypothetical protein
MREAVISVTNLYLYKLLHLVSVQMQASGLSVFCLNCCRLSFVFLKYLQNPELIHLARLSLVG